MSQLKLSKDPATHRMIALLSGMSLLMTLATFAVIIWAMPRGFDMTDEAWLYTLVANNRATVGEFWGFHHILNPIFDITGQSVLVFRVLRLLGYLVVSIVLVLAARGVVSSLGWFLGWKKWAAVLIVAQIGTFIAWSYPPRYLGYNEISGWLVQIGAALLLLAFLRGSSQHPQLREAWLAGTWVAIGWIVAMLCATKISSGVVFGVVAVAFLCLPSRPSFGKRIASLALGAIAAVGALAMLSFPFGSYFRNLLQFVTNPQVQTDNAHPVGELLEGYVDSISDAANVLLPSIALLIALVGLLGIRLARIRADATSVVIGRVAVLMSFALVIALFSWNPPAPFTGLGYLALFLFAATVIVWVGIPKVANPALTAQLTPFKVATSSALLFVTPFIAAVGTTNGIAGQLLYAATMWSIALALVMLRLTDRLIIQGTRLAAIPALVIVCIIAITASGVVRDAEEPYRSAPYSVQQASTSAPYLQGILLTAEQAKWSDWLAESGTRLHADGVPTVALGSPAALLAFNSSDFANPWIKVNWPVSISSVKYACANEIPDRLIVLEPEFALDKEILLAEFSAALSTCQMSFPEDFDLVTTRSSEDPTFDMKIWQSKDATKH